MTTYNQICKWTILFVLVCAATVTNAATQQTLRFVTFNVNYNLSTAKVRSDVQTLAPYADIMMFQEAKTVTINNFLDSSWTVVQVVNQGDAKRGSALAIRNSVMSQKLAEGLRFGVDADGQAMLDRYIAWADIRLTNHQTLRIMSLHMPPGRFAYLQPRMANNLNTFVAETSYPVIVGGDWNFTVNNDPYNIKTNAGLEPRGLGIDGFYYNKQVITYVSITELTSLSVNSDHDPVQMVGTVQGLESEVSDWQLYK